MRKMVERNIFYAHHHTPPVPQNCVSRCLRVKGRLVPISTYQGRQRRQGCEMFENDAHLQAAMLARTVHIEMHSDGAKNACRMLDIGNQRPEPAESLFLAPHLVF